MIITNFDSWGEVAEFDPKSGSIKKFPRSELPENVRYLNHGDFTDIDATPFVFYRDDCGGLNLRIANEIVSIDESVTMSWEQVRAGGYWRFRLAEWVVSARGREYRWRYRNWAKVGPALTSYATFGEELEHFDFGLFVTTVVNDPGRRSQIYLPPTD